MKNYLSVIALLLVTTLPVTINCRRGETSAYQFESKPRAVLSEAGIPSSNDPKLALSSSGTIALLSVHGGQHQQLALFLSHNGGDTFSKPVPVSEPDAHVHSHGENSPSLAYTPTEIYALWEQAVNQGNDLVFGRSINFGHSFEKPVRVTDKSSPSFNGFSSFGVAPDGTIYVIWLDGRDEQEIPGTFSLYLAKSTDRGATFSKNQKIAGGVCPCCRAAIAFDSDKRIHIAWRKVFPPDIRDIVVSTSSDGGVTFLQPVRVAEDNWKLNGCPHSGPAIAAKGNKVYITWYTEGSAAKPGIKFSSSQDQGKTFSRAIDASGEILDANHPSISVSEDGRVAVAFQGRPPQKSHGWSPAEVYIATVSPSGRLLPAEVIPGNGKPVSYPSIAAGNSGRFYVAWTEPGDKDRRIMISRGRLAKLNYE